MRANLVAIRANIVSSNSDLDIAAVAIAKTIVIDTVVTEQKTEYGRELSNNIPKSLLLLKNKARSFIVLLGCPLLAQ